MSRGMLAGGLFCTTLALVGVIMVSSPSSPWSAWLFAVTEAYSESCAFGEGIWTTNMHFGPTVLQHSKGANCDVPDNRGSILTWEIGNTTSSSNEATWLPQKKRLPSRPLFVNAEFEYCREPARDGEVGMCGAVRVGRTLSLVGLLTSIIGVGLGVRAHWRGHSETLEAKLIHTRRAMWITLASATAHMALVAVVSTSPLFTRAHWYVLGMQNVVNYRDLGCVFQSPFLEGLAGLMTSHPLKCLFPGPALPIMCTSLCLQLLGVIIYFMLERRITIAGSIRHTSVQSTNPSVVILRRYSLHGALMRRLGGLREYERRFIGTIVPLFVLGNGALLVAWFYHGTQFVVHVKVHDAVVGEDGSKRELGITIVELMEQVFSFDPVTSLKNFWESGGILLTIMTGLWIDAFPFFKILVWIVLYYVPTEEVTRGRLLTWIDYLGKWSLMNIFTLIIIGTAFMFDTTMTIPLFARRAIAVDISVQYVPGPGVDWFVLSIVWTVALGNAFLDLHTRARRWHMSDLIHDDTNTNLSGFVFIDEATGERRRTGSELNASVPLFGVISDVSRRAARRFNSAMNAVLDQGPTESLSNHRHRPIEGEMHVFSVLAKTLIWTGLVVTWLLTLSGLVTPLVTIRRAGAVGNLLVSSDSRVVSSGLLDYARDMVACGGPTKPVLLSAALVAFGFVLPLAHLAALVVAWGAPFTLVAQEKWFRLCELLDAWSALEVFVMASLVVYVGLHSISIGVVDRVVPGIKQALSLLPGGEVDEVFELYPELGPGFGVMVAALGLKFLVTHFVMSLSAVAIAERSSRAATSVSTALLTPAMEAPEAVSSRFGVPEPVTLSPSVLVMFSPANRYAAVSGLPTRTSYAGFPLRMWTWVVHRHLMHRVSRSDESTELLEER